MTRSPLTWRGRVYIGAVFLAGLAAVAQSGVGMWSSALGPEWMLFALLTWVSGPFAIKVPTIAATISVSEAFVFTSILLYGPGPATVTVALDGLFTSIYRRNTAPRRLMFNVAEPALSCWLGGQAFFWLSGSPPLSVAQGDVLYLFLPVMLLGITYFAFNSGLTAVAVWFETGVSPVEVWRKHFAWLSVNYFGGASIAVLLAVNMRVVNIGSLIAILPLLAILYLTFKSWTKHLEDTHQHLAELNELYMSTVESLATAVDAKDQVTHGHIRRVQAFSIRLARALGITNDLELKAIEAAALLHDMGKLAIPDYILNKPGKLTPAEYEKMKLHAAAGAEILAAVRFPYPVVPIVRHHHEAWDGSGYPDGIRGPGIPVGARILSVIDCFDALTSDRPYRPAMTVDQAIEIIKEGQGTRYDPIVVDAFIKHHGVICAPVELADVPRDTVIDQIIEACREPWERAPSSAEAAGAEHYGEAILGLCELADVVAGHATLEDVIERTLRHLRRVVPVSLAALYLVDARANRLVLAHASGFGEDRLKGLTLDLGEGVSGWVAANGTSMVNSDPRLDFAGRLDGCDPRPESTLSVALVSGAESVGVLALYAMQVDAFTPQHTKLVELVSRQLAPTLAHASRFRDEQATHLRDGETGLPNALYLQRLAASPGFAESQIMKSLGVLRVRPARRPPGIEAPACVDVAIVVIESVRVADMVFRSDAGEVVVLMPECDATAGELVSSRIRARWAERSNESRADVIAVSFGCAPLDGGTLQALLDVTSRRLMDGSDGCPVRVEAAIDPLAMDLTEVS